MYAFGKNQGIPHHERFVYETVGRKACYTLSLMITNALKNDLPENCARRVRNIGNERSTKNINEWVCMLWRRCGCHDNDAVWRNAGGVWLTIRT